MIFFKKDFKVKVGTLNSLINYTVFPRLQGGPHNHAIAAICTQMGEVQKPYFKEYIRQVKANMATLAKFLIESGYTLRTNGTDNHLGLVDLRPLGLTGSKLQRICDEVHICLNKNSIWGDKK